MSRAVAVLGLVALAVSACSAPTNEPAGAAADDEIAAPVFPGVERILSDVGVSEEPCAQASGSNRGCIFLGALVDEGGAFGALETAALEGARAFWEHINEEGGIADRYDVDLSGYVQQLGEGSQPVLDAFDDIDEDVLALAVVPGSDVLQTAVHRLKERDAVAVPMSWWSGWAWEPIIAESGVNYCMAAMNGLDWVWDQRPRTAPVNHVVVIRHPGTFGDDVLAGVEHWVEEERVPFDANEHAVAVAEGGDLSRAVEAIEAFDPLAVVLATTPQTTADLLVEVAGFGWDGTAVGLAPTYQPSLLDDPDAAATFEERFLHVSPYAPLEVGTGKAYDAMREAAADGDPANLGWVAGWVNQYPLETALLEATRAGDLTRAGVATIIREIPLHYEGALPRTRYGGDPTTASTRRSWLLRPDGGAPLGETLVTGPYVGSTAEDFPLTRPCTED